MISFKTCLLTRHCLIMCCLCHGRGAHISPHAQCAGTANELSLAMDELFVEGVTPDSQKFRMGAPEPGRKVGEHIKDEEMEELKEVPELAGDADDRLDAVPSMDINSLEVGAVVSTMEQERVEVPDPVEAAAAPPPGSDAGRTVDPPDPAAVLETRRATHQYDGQVSGICDAQMANACASLPVSLRCADLPSLLGSVVGQLRCTHLLNRMTTSSRSRWGQRSWYFRSLTPRTRRRGGCSATLAERTEFSLQISPKAQGEPPPPVLDK
jgi:hypothetical protein